jgi:hypothetical protein
MSGLTAARPAMATPLELADAAAMPVGEVLRHVRRRAALFARQSAGLTSPG